MSIAIDVNRVTEVLLADGWHSVAGGSFTIDSYEYVCEEELLLPGGHESLIPARGFTFSEPDRRRISGSLTAILAVREIMR
jgi:hypothetical protein